ncbi:MAG: hypothetical protein JKY27_07985 [Magnetovibrio sp.]|nr:hypothetical protein [Magnetovibrio sp.]
MLEVFENHPHCLLNKDHFSALAINWNNKAENMSALGADLNIALDSFVFLDDSAFECTQIQGRLPDIEVRQVPKRLYDYPDFVAGFIDELFFTAHLTSEDSARTELYAARHKATLAKSDFNDIDAYLRSLNITADIHKMRPEEISRVAQLTHKTNQFNLAKTPYSEGDITAFHNNDQWSVYVMVVTDQFGELGLTNVCIVNHELATPFIDTLLMSCRVFERNLEYAFVNHVIEDITRQHNPARIRAQFKPSPKNTVAKTFYAKMGFFAESQDDQIISYALDVPQYQPKTFDYIRHV